MQFTSLSAAVLAGSLFSIAAIAAPTVVDFSDQAVGAPAAALPNPLIYPTVSFSSTSGLRTITFPSFGIDRALCPHATFACQSALTLTFAQPVDHIAFDVIQVDELGKFLNVSATTANGAVSQSIALTRALTGNHIELSTLAAVTRLTLDGTSDVEGVLFDNFSFDVGGTVPGVPEPGSWAMLAAGCAAIVGNLRRRGRLTHQ